MVTTTMVKDPVCEMELAKTHKTESFEYQGRSYYFCSVGCRAEFLRHAEDYVERAQVDQGVKEDV
jgi:Cu+-exporting ATPase